MCTSTYDSAIKCYKNWDQTIVGIWWHLGNLRKTYRSNFSLRGYAVKNISMLKQIILV